MRTLNRILDALSNFLAVRKGLLPLIGLILVILNFVVQFLPLGWFSSSDILLHLGLVLAILGFLLAWAL